MSVAAGAWCTVDGVPWEGEAGTGGTYDPVCAVRPDATHTYTGRLLTRTVWADGRETLYTWVARNLTVEKCGPIGGPYSTKTHTYTGRFLTGTAHS